MTPGRFPSVPSTSVKAVVFLGLFLGIGACGSPQTPSPPPSPLATAAFADRTLGLEPAKAEGTPRKYRYVKIPKAWGRKLSRDQFIVDHARDPESFYGYLYGQNLVFESYPGDGDIEVLDEAKIRTSGIKTLPIQPTQESSVIGSIDDGRTDIAQGYHNDSQLTLSLMAAEKSAPNLAALSSIGKSVQGRDLWMVKISDNVGQDEQEPKVLMIANMHGDEVVGRELMIYLVEHLIAQYQKDPAITEMINSSQIYIIPSMNPDGFELKQRFNADGVDLNRDFPDFTSDPTNTPEGRAPETRAVMALFKNHHFLTSYNFHGGEVCFNLPWDTQENISPRLKFGDDRLITQWGRAYADLNPTMKANSGGSFDRGLTYGFEWYEVDGGLQDWSIHYHESLHGTIELSYAKWPPARDLTGLWNENRSAILRLLNRTREGIHLKLIPSGTDQSGAIENTPVVDASITVAGLGRTLTYQTPYIHRNALQSLNSQQQKLGKIEVKIEAKGFQPLNIEVPWGIFTDKFQEIKLVPLRQENVVLEEPRLLVP